MIDLIYEHINMSAKVEYSWMDGRQKCVKTLVQNINLMWGISTLLVHDGMVSSRLVCHFLFLKDPKIITKM